jgi:hypothetical protein
LTESMFDAVMRRAVQLAPARVNHQPPSALRPGL